MLRTLSAAVAAWVLAAAAPALADPPPVEDYGKLPAMDMVTLSPDGDRYAFVADDAQGVRRLYVLTTDNKPRLLQPIGKVKVRNLTWAGDNFLMVAYSATTDTGVNRIADKEELWSYVVFNLKTNRAVQVFQNQEHIQPLVCGSFGVANIKGRWYGYFGGETLIPIGLTGDVDYANTTSESDGFHIIKHIIPDLYRVDLETGATEMVAKGEANAYGWLVGPDGAVVARALYSQRLSYWKVMSGAFGGVQLDAGQNPLGGAQLLGLGHTPNTVLLEEPDAEGYDVKEVALTGGPATPQPGVGEHDPIYDADTQLWIGQTGDESGPTPKLFDPGREAKLRGAMKAFPGYQVRLVSWSSDFNHLIMFTDGADDSGTYWIVDIAKGSANILGAAYPSVTQSYVGPTQWVNYKASDGLALQGVLTLPPGRPAKNLPVVVMVHGGPVERDSPKFDWWPQAFASRGYAVFQPNFRGSSGYGLGFVESGFGQWGRKMQTDVSDGVAELARQGVIDAKRACIVGASYGGYAALAGVTIQHGLYRCAVSVAGISDPARMIFDAQFNAGGYGQVERDWKALLGVTGDYDPLTAIAPAKQAGRADAPILLIHGDRDTAVPIEQTNEMETALKAAGKPVERLTLTGADHALHQEDSRIAMVKASVAFVEKYNPPDPAPAAVAATSPQPSVH